MIKFEDFIKPPNPKSTKVKFNMKPSDSNVRAWDLLSNDDPDWIIMNSWKANNIN